MSGETLIFVKPFGKVSRCNLLPIDSDNEDVGYNQKRAEHISGGRENRMIPYEVGNLNEINRLLNRYFRHPVAKRHPLWKYLSKLRQIDTPQDTDNY